MEGAKRWLAAWQSLERPRPQSQGSTDHDSSTPGNHRASSSRRKVLTSSIDPIDQLKIVSNGDVQR